MADWENFQHGKVTQIGDGAYAYTQVGGWGFNNQALVVSEGQTLLMDTTSDIPMTTRMLESFARADPAANRIDVLTLTHWHVDHVNGACMPIFEDTRIICTREVEDYMADLPPKAWLGREESLKGDAKKEMDRNKQDFFDFSGLSPIEPTETFAGRMEFEFGGQKVILVEAKPCHTASDTVIYLPDAGVVHMGDITGAYVHQGLQYPGMSSVIEILEEVQAWEARAYVAGHGPVMDVHDIRVQLDYSRWVQEEARRRFDKGMDYEAAADDLLEHLGDKADRRNPFGLYASMMMMFNEFAGKPNQHLRKNYPRFLTNSWRLRQEFPKRHPQFATDGAQRTGSLRAGEHDVIYADLHRRRRRDALRGSRLPRRGPHGSRR